MSSGTTWDANGFHTGGLEGCASTAGTLVVSTPVPWTSKQTYRAKISNTTGSNITSNSKAVGTDWVTFVFYIRFETHANTATFFNAYDGTNSHLVLNRKSDKAMELFNANGTLIATSAAGLLADDTDYIFSVKFKKNNSADIQVEVGEAGSFRDVIFDLTGQDLDTGAANVSARFLNDSASTVATDFFVTTYLCRTDTGANIDTNITTEPNGLTIFGEYESINQGTAMDFGDSLSSGSLANMFDVPVTSSMGTYTTTGVDKSGGVTMDHGTLGGPTGDTRVDGNIVGSIYLWVFRTGGNLNSKFRGKHGWQSVGSEGTDNTTTTTLSIKTDNTWQTLIVLESESDLPANPETKLLQMGFKSSVAFSNGDVDVKLMAVGLIHSEQTIARASSGSLSLIISRGGVVQTSGDLFIHGDTPYTGDKLYLLGWGENSFGQVDIPSPADQFSAADGGYEFTVGLKTDRSITAWGKDNFGQLSIPSQTWADYIAVACGTDHGLALKANGSIIAWGRNSDGQLNIPSPNEEFIAVDGGFVHTVGLKSSGTILVWGDDGESVPSLRNVPSPNNDFVALSAGRIHNIALTSSGTIEAWGADNSGQGTNPSGNSDFTAISAGGFHNMGLKDDGSVFCWGSNTEGQLDVPSPNSGFIAIQAGRLFSLGLKANGTVIGWGRNVETQLDVPLPNTYFDSIAVGAGSMNSLGFVSVVPHTASGNMFIGGLDEYISSIPPTLFVNGHEPLTSSSDVFIEGNEFVSTSGDLVIFTKDAIQTSGDLFIIGVADSSGNTDNFIKGKDTKSNTADLFLTGIDNINTSKDLLIQGLDNIILSTTLFIGGSDESSGAMSPSLFINGHNDTIVSADLFTHGVDQSTNTSDLFIRGFLTGSQLNSADLFLRGTDNISTSEDLFIKGLDNTILSTTLFVDGLNKSTNISDLFIQGSSIFDQNDTLKLFVAGLNIISDNADLFISVYELSTSSSDMFIEGNEFVSTSGDLVIFTKDAIQTSGDLFIIGVADSSGNIDNFTRGKDTESNTADLFILGSSVSGHTDTSTLFIAGINVISDNVDLLILSSDTVSVSGNMYISGPIESSSQINLFISSSGTSAIASSFGLFINGIEPKPALVCPTLDPTASIQIKDSLITIYQQRIDALINQLGKNVQLEFTPIRVPCRNCEYDTIRKRSTGVYKSGGPRPFSRGRKCPWCKGRGFEETQTTKCIKCLIKWNPQDLENFGISIGEKKGVVRLKTFLTEADDLIRAQTAVTNRDIEDQLKLRVKLIQGPIPVGLRERRYCISFWELI